MMVDYSFVPKNISLVQERIQAAAERAGRNPSDIQLLAVTKFHPAEAVIEAYSCGIRRFGENRVQEAIGKYSPETMAAIPGSEIDLIGTLQSNKVNKALKLFDSIQSVGSIGLLEAVAARVHERDKKLRLFLELHTGEASKSGFPDIDTLLKAIETYEVSKPKNMIELAGLMTMAPFTNDEKRIRGSFKALYRAFEEVGKRFSLPGFKELSMGMSGDFEIAIEEGSTLLRIGTAIFGARQ